MTDQPEPDRLAKNLRDARRRLTSTLVANADRLDKPFTDDPSKNPWDTFVRPAMRELKTAADAAVDALTTVVSPTAADRAALRDRIRRAVCEAEGFTWDSDMLEPDEYGDHADMVLAALFGPIPEGTDTATWTAIRAIQLMNEAGRERDAAEEQRLALSEALSLGTGAPWDAIRERAAELAAQAAPADRAAADDLPDRLEAALTERFTELGNPFAAMRYHEQGPDGWPASHPVGPRRVAEVLRELLTGEAQQDGAKT
jgi:hypothetical protein